MRFERKTIACCNIVGSVWLLLGGEMVIALTVVSKCTLAHYLAQHFNGI